MTQIEEPDAGAGSPLVAAVRSDDVATLRSLLEAGADLSARDGDGWSALDWAAGRGNVDVIGVLLAHGADPAAAADDDRKPYDVAVAAGHVDAALLLREAAARADPDEPVEHLWRPYCRAYPLSELRRYPGWPRDVGSPAVDAGPPTDPDSDSVVADIVFLHDDLSVTASMWPGEDVLFVDDGPAWAVFCANELGFAVPDEIDLVPSERPADPS